MLKKQKFYIFLCTLDTLEMNKLKLDNMAKQSHDSDRFTKKFFIETTIEKLLIHYIEKLYIDPLRGTLL